jgi:hypothetical protein
MDFIEWLGIALAGWLIASLLFAVGLGRIFGQIRRSRRLTPRRG